MIRSVGNDRSQQQKGKTLVSRIIVVVLCIAMVVTLLVSAF